MTSKSTSSNTKASIFSVSELNRLARTSLEKDFSSIRIEGEVSDLIQHRSGHWYFTLKDDQAQLRAAMFRSSNQKVSFKPENGQQVLLSGKLSIYEARGSYQFIANSMELDGKGQLQRNFDQLKKELSSQGLFDAIHKKSLPEFPKQIAIVTSPQGAAIKDITSTFARRFPSIELILVPVAVQGDSAAASIATAITQLNQAAKDKNSSIKPDAIIIGRGGGSIEDLWAFNEAIVAHAIFNSNLPIVSAVGHETDFTISDYIADVRAATPTAAAELLSPNTDELFASFNSYLTYLKKAITKQLSHQQLSLNAIRNQLKHPGDRIQQQIQMLDHLDNRLQRSLNDQLTKHKQQLRQHRHSLQVHSPETRIQQQKLQVNYYQQQLNTAISVQIEKYRHRCVQLASAIDIVSPLATLSRGYCIVEKEDGSIVHSRNQVAIGDKINNRISDGVLQSEVKEIV